jgi:hypothetical protein
LLNSLRITGNDERLVVLDRGLTPGQRAQLERHATLADVDVDRAAGPYAYKAFPHLYSATGVVVVIDSDMIVTRSLADILQRAEEGRICVFADYGTFEDRWFGEWHEILELRAPLRRQRYVNSGFVAFSTRHWPDLLRRWWETCGRIPPEQVFTGVENPFFFADQDALNALIASEVPADAIEILPEEEQCFHDGLLETDVLDPRTLKCSFRGGRPRILHYGLAPKPWEGGAWLRIRDDAYIRLLPRLLFGADVPLRLRPRAVPIWLRPGLAGRASVRVLDLLHGGLRAAAHATPAPIRKRLLSFRQQLFHRARDAARVRLAQRRSD